MDLLSSVVDHLARDEGRGHSAARFLEAWMPIRSPELLGDVAYGPHPRQRLDLYRPLQTSGKCRLVVFLYGGCWTTGTRRAYRFLAHVLGSRGFAVAIPDHRLFPEARFPDFLIDTASAIDWLIGTRASTGSTATAWHCSATLWTAEPDGIIEKVRRGYQSSQSPS